MIQLRPILASSILYGHKLLFFLSLQRIIENHKNPGIILIVQSMFKWMIPKSEIAELWTVNPGFHRTL